METVKQITLSKGQFAIVDPNLFEELNKFKWSVEGRTGKFYASRRINGKLIKMHRFILGLEDPKICVDHINGNTLDNRISNLRICTWAQNLRNSAIKPSNKSGYKGVCFSEKLNRFRATIKVNYKQIHLGVFRTAIEAARAYNAAAILHHGEFARLNEIPA